jgi:hypothetical protein
MEAEASQKAKANDPAPAEIFLAGDSRESTRRRATSRRLRGYRKTAYKAYPVNRLEKNAFLKCQASSFVEE